MFNPIGAPGQESGENPRGMWDGVKDTSKTSLSRFRFRTYGTGVGRGKKHSEEEKDLPW